MKKRLQKVSFSSKKKKKNPFLHWSDMKSHHHIFDLQKKRLQKKDYKSQKFLACRKKYYKRQKEEKKRPLSETLHLDSKKKKNTLWLTHQLVLAIDLVCSQIFISGSFFVFSSFASFVFFMVCSLLLGVWVFFFLKRSLLCYCSLLLSKEYKQCRQDSREQTKRVTLQKGTLRFL